MYSELYAHILNQGFYFIPYCLWSSIPCFTNYLNVSMMSTYYQSTLSRNCFLRFLFIQSSYVQSTFLHYSYSLLIKFERVERVQRSSTRCLSSFLLFEDRLPKVLLVSANEMPVLHPGICQWKACTTSRYLPIWCLFTQSSVEQSRNKKQKNQTIKQ